MAATPRVTTTSKVVTSPGIATRALAGAVSVPEGGWGEPARDEGAGRAGGLPPAFGHAAARSAARAPWYIGETVTPTDIEPLSSSDVSVRDERRRVRYERRRRSAGWLVGEARARAGLPRDAQIKIKHGDPDWIATPRPARCGQRIAARVPVHVNPEHGAHYSGTERCASIHACPVCSAVIRAERALEVTDAVQRHAANGGRLAFVTLTMRHRDTDALKVTLEAALDGWRRTIRGKPWVRRRDALGVVGYVRTVEVTHGRSGWHPHIHALLFLDDAMTENERADFEAWLYTRWSRMVTKLGGGMPTRAHGCRVDIASSDGEMLAQYLTKVQEKAPPPTKTKVALELTRTDLKTARIAGNRTPFELLDSANDDETARDLWCEYVDATYGRRAITWSLTLRDDLGMTDERTDQQILDDTEPAPVAAFIPAKIYDTRRTTAHWLTTVLETAETGNLDLLLALTDGYLPDEPIPPPSPPLPPPASATDTTPE